MGLITGYSENLGEVDWVSSVNAKILRHEFLNAPDAWDDSFYRKTASLGMTVVPLINATTVPATSTARESFAQLVRAHVARYGPNGSFWRENPILNAGLAPQVFEVMNEPYIETQGGPYNPAGYASLMRRTAELVRSTDPSARLAMATATTYVGSSNNGAPWLDALYQAEPNLNAYFDAVAVHPYGHDPATCDPAFRWCFRQVEVIRSRLVARGAGDKRVVITEIGNNTRGPGAHSESEQAQYLNRYVALSKSYGYVDALLYYNYNDFCSDTGNKECWFGITRPDGSRKPAFHALHAAATENP